MGFFLVFRRILQVQKGFVRGPRKGLNKGLVRAFVGFFSYGVGFFVGCSWGVYRASIGLL